MDKARESMDFDVVIVGGGPAGLSAAIRLHQLASAAGKTLEICIVEKGASIGAHILSGAVIETTALDELIPDWQTLNSPITTKVSKDNVQLLYSAHRSINIPHWAAPKTLRNSGNYIVSLSHFCQWLGDYAEQLGIHVFPGFCASEVLYDKSGSVCGIATGDMGLDSQGQAKAHFERGMALHARYTIFAEGCRGHLGKQLIGRFKLDADCDPQHYGLGVKELWQVPKAQHQSGLVLHTAGWPLSESRSTGGGFVYHFGDDWVALGLITDLSYRNPTIDPFAEMQRYKTHPAIAQYLRGGQRIGYGARALAKGGLQSLPSMTFAGGVLVGDEAGTLNAAKIKGTHTAMKSGMLAAESIYAELSEGQQHTDVQAYATAYRQSWAYQELHQQRNFAPAQHRWGNLLGSAYAFIDLNLLNGRVPWTLRDRQVDATQLKPVDQIKTIDYPAPDGELTFDRASSLYLAGIAHDEDQPVHLQLADDDEVIQDNIQRFAEPAQRYCPAGVFELVEHVNAHGKQQKKLHINAQNCVHCKTCDIKDPAQNITWTVPEGGSGPNYSNM